MKNKRRNISLPINTDAGKGNGLYHYTLNSGHMKFQPFYSLYPEDFKKISQLWELSLEDGGLNICLFYRDVQFNITSDINDDVASTLLSVYIGGFKLPLIHSYVGIQGSAAYDKAIQLSITWSIPSYITNQPQAAYLIDVINPLSYALFISMLQEKGVTNPVWTGDYCRCMGLVMMKVLQKLS